MSVIVPKDEWDAYQESKMKKAQSDAAIDNLKVKKMVQGEPSQVVKTSAQEGALKVKDETTPSSSPSSSSSTDSSSDQEGEKKSRKKKKRKAFSRSGDGAVLTKKEKDDIFHYINTGQKRDKAAILYEELMRHPEFEFVNGNLKHNKQVLGNAHFIFHKVFAHASPPLAKGGRTALKKLVNARLLSQSDFSRIFKPKTPPPKDKSQKPAKPSPPTPSSAPPSGSDTKKKTRFKVKKA
jgi:hypothetical protein